MSPFAPGNLASRDRFDRPVPRQPAHYPSSRLDLFVLTYGILPYELLFCVYSTTFVLYGKLHPRSRTTCACVRGNRCNPLQLYVFMTLYLFLAFDTQDLYRQPHYCCIRKLLMLLLYYLLRRCTVGCCLLDTSNLMHGVPCIGFPTSGL